MDFLTKQLHVDNEVKMAFQMSVSKPKTCICLYTTWHDIVANPIMIAKGWKHIGF